MGRIGRARVRTFRDAGGLSMRAHHHAGASARLDTAFARESAEKEMHHANQTTKQPSTRKPRSRPTQKKQAKRTKGAQDTASNDHVDDVEDIVPDEMPTEHEPLFELSERHPRFGHRMASKRKRGKKGSGGSGVTDADASDDSVGADDYSIGVDAQNAEMLAELMLCASADDSGGTADHEGTEEARRFDRMASLESDADADADVDAFRPRQGGNDALRDASRHPRPTLVRTNAAQTIGHGLVSRPSAEPKATREWAEAALGALVRRNLRDPLATLHIPPLGGAAFAQRPTSAGKVDVLPAAARIMQRFLAHQAAGSEGSTTLAKTRSDESAVTTVARSVVRSSVGSVGASKHDNAKAAPFAATVEAARQSLVNSSTAQGLKPVPRDKLGHEQELFNLTVVLFHLALHTPRRHLQLGAVQARRRMLNRRLSVADA